MNHGIKIANEYYKLHNMQGKDVKATCDTLPKLQYTADL